MLTSLNIVEVEVMEVEVIDAVSLLLEPLSTQIIRAGGRGFNCDVNVEAISGSFSCIYRFNTDCGTKAIRTKNVLVVGMVDDIENHFIEFNGDTNEYTLVTPKAIRKPESKTILLVKSLGFNYEDMRSSVQAIWPERRVWKLNNPELLTSMLG